MLVPTAVPNVSPLAVLVLAWNEAAPAVRALLEATEASTPLVDSILVMVPQADAPDLLSAEEYLPVRPLVPEPPLAPTAAPEPELLPTLATALTLSELVTSGSGNLVGQQNSSNEEVTPTQIPVTALVPAPLTWTAVRVLRLSSFSLPQLAQQARQPLPAPTWIGTSLAPAAPYLGAGAPLHSPEENPPKSRSTDREPTATVTPTTELHLPSELQPTTELAEVSVALPAAAAALPPAVPRYEPTEAAQAPDLEADLQPSETDEVVDFKLPASGLADITVANQPFVDYQVQANWQGALAALRQPASLPEPELVPEPPVAVPTTHPALQPAAAHYPAPNLNFQIIQYARFAVPVALAEPPFAVVYAPAWPTWLAAQELRQRTGRPLVLHVSTLAAADDESVETATGWIAELQRQALRRADLILAETPALARRLRHDLGLPASAVQIVPAINAAAITQALHEAQLRSARSPIS
jgi:hypothetical protein